MGVQDIEDRALKLYPASGLRPSDLLLTWPIIFDLLI